MRLLWYGESPFISTGAGQVARNLLPVFQEMFSDIHLVPINQWWVKENLPPGLRITPGEPTDAWNMDNAKRAIAACDYDCLFLTTDINKITDMRVEIEQAHRRGIPIVMYAAMDTHIFTRQFWDILELATVPIVFSEWCKRHALHVLPDLADSLQVIYHGCEPDVFYPLSAEERRAARSDIFNIEDETFLVLNVNRNQVRKDLARSMAAFHLFHMDNPNSLLYLHSKRRDLGGDLPTQATYLGLRIRGEKPEIVFTPDGYHETDGVTREELNRIYNAADCCISTSTGEGWGLTTTEAMAAGTPFIGPDNTVFPEILGRGAPLIDDWTSGERGLLVKSGGPDLWTLFYGIGDTPRELCSTTGMKASLEDVYQYRGHAARRAARARAWAEDHTWAHVQEQWRQVLAGVGSNEYAE